MILDEEKSRLFMKRHGIRIKEMQKELKSLKSEDKSPENVQKAIELAQELRNILETFEKEIE